MDELDGASSMALLNNSCGYCCTVEAECISDNDHTSGQADKRTSGQADDRTHVEKSANFTKINHLNVSSGHCRQ